MVLHTIFLSLLLFCLLLCLSICLRLFYYFRFHYNTFDFYIHVFAPGAAPRYYGDLSKQPGTLARDSKNTRIVKGQHHEEEWIGKFLLCTHILTGYSVIFPPLQILLYFSPNVYYCFPKHTYRGIYTHTQVIITHSSHQSSLLFCSVLLWYTQRKYKALHIPTKKPKLQGSWKNVRLPILLPFLKKKERVIYYHSRCLLYPTDRVKHPKKNSNNNNNYKSSVSSSCLPLGI